jgi:hypothetical protein
MAEDVDYYATSGPMTDLAGLDDALAGMPEDPAAIAAVVQGVVLHPFWAAAYGVDLPEDRANDVQIRPASGIVECALQLDPRPLVERREPPLRFAGNCRHFSTLTVALLRRAGVPSRARCGFAGYFEAGKWVDHWVVEHWDGARWVMLDAQIDELQRRATGLPADPTDLPPGMFLPAGEAWLRCRSGELDGDRFGILDMWGQWFIAGNIARDLAALNKVEMLPWDGWGTLASDKPPPGGDEYVDEVASLTVSGDFAAIRKRYTTDDDLRVPSRVVAFFTPRGPTEVDVPELV